MRAIEPSGLPLELTKHIRDLLDIDIFIETGTGLGRTIANVAGIFGEIYTIEVDEERWEEAGDRFANYDHVHCILGQSPDALVNVLDNIAPRQAIVFLDTHCLYREQVTDNACPLLLEIGAVRAASQQHVIIVDDQHVFTSVPVDLKHREAYPELPEVVNALYKHSYPYIIIEDKAIVAVPRIIKNQIDMYLHQEKYGNA